MEKCGFYKPDLEAMSIVNLPAEGVSWTTVFSRRFKEFGLQELKRGMSLTMRTGFNVFDSVNAQARSAGGSGEEFTVTLAEAAQEQDSALDNLLSVGSLSTGVLLSLLLAF